MKDTGVAYQSVRQIRNILAFAAVILFLFVLKTASEVTLPIALALFIFAFINPLMERLGRLKVPNIISIVISLSLVAVIFFGFIYVLILMVNMLLERKANPAMPLQRLLIEPGLVIRESCGAPKQ